ncbi:MAG: inositol-3-phosphate synthase [Planctomycetes bacterium]|nr:inositol-3-phosphate synthase [Planctomycetota bacterium]
MADQKIGVWLIGAWGGVSTTVAVGLNALARGLAGETALVTALPQLAKIEPIPWDRFVLGGHEIRATSYADEAGKLHRESRVFAPELLDAIGPALMECDARIRPGTLINVGRTIEALASPEAKKASRGETAVAAIERLSGDLQAFRTQNDLSNVIVVNLASTEPPPDEKVRDVDWPNLSKLLNSDGRTPVSASTLYAIAAMLAECPYINFTPSAGSNLPALEELALQQGVLHAGRDGKTGETLMKAVLAPMFAARNLHVMSWVGHNIFGNMDGKVLDDPVNKASKVRSKDQLLTDILGYKPQTLVTIEFIESMGDWKTAWDHIHFQGFLGTPMAMQFTWQGCDSLLAAPLVLDLVRLTEREWRRGKSGVMRHLASFFKSPMGADIPPEFGRQYELLLAWANEVAGKTPGAAGGSSAAV